MPLFLKHAVAGGQEIELGNDPAKCCAIPLDNRENSDTPRGHTLRYVSEVLIRIRNDHIGTHQIVSRSLQLIGRSSFKYIRPRHDTYQCITVHDRQ